jgi:hypothetical protein
MKILAQMVIVVALVTTVLAQTDRQEQIKASHDPVSDVTTVRSKSVRLDGNNDRYHSLDFTLEYSYPGQTRRIPGRINLNLVSVVKARKLNSDLYVVFLVDGKTIHFSSNRSAIRNPVPGRLWVGERMAFLIPYEDFLKLAAAEKLSVKLGGVEFEFGDDARNALRLFVNELKE